VQRREPSRRAKACGAAVGLGDLRSIPGNLGPRDEHVGRRERDAGRLTVFLGPAPQLLGERSVRYEDINACIKACFGRLAQLGEHQLDKLGVTGSSPVPPIEKGP
jgi:hypothetical protein